MFASFVSQQIRFSLFDHRILATGHPRRIPKVSLFNKGNVSFFHEFNSPGCTASSPRRYRWWNSLTLFLVEVSTNTDNITSIGIDGSINLKEVFRPLLAGSSETVNRWPLGSAVQIHAQYIVVRHRHHRCGQQKLGMCTGRYKPSAPRPVCIRLFIHRNIDGAIRAINVNLDDGTNVSRSIGLTRRPSNDKTYDCNK